MMTNKCPSCQRFTSGELPNSRTPMHRVVRAAVELARYATQMDCLIRKLMDEHPKLAFYFDEVKR